MLSSVEYARNRLSRLGDILRQVRLASKVTVAYKEDANRRPVLFFNASTRLSGLSQNAGFSLLVSWILRMAGIPVVHFVCRSGMSRCVLGTDETDLDRRMPCGMCLRQSRINTLGSHTRWFSYKRDTVLAGEIQELNLDALLKFEKGMPGDLGVIPLGGLVLPSLRWRLRRHNLCDDEQTRFLCREFILSAWNIVLHLLPVLIEVKPQAAVVFNGIQFPEAVAAWLCRFFGILVTTHESGFRPLSGYFFNEKDCTYPIVLPDDDLTPEQDAFLDEELDKRWHGDFSMAGVRFWKEMHSLPEDLLSKAAAHQQVVPIFTNVIFDTSQRYANTIFPDMFCWLNDLLELIGSNPQTLFILRAHPDEARAGKASRESVAMWFEEYATHLPNLLLVSAEEKINSYDLVKKANFVLIYNSNIGLEAILHGIPALAAAQAPYIPYDTVYFEPERVAYDAVLAQWLSGKIPKVSPERQQNTRRFLYHRNYRCSIPFGEFMESTPPLGYVRLKEFVPSRLLQSAIKDVFLGGIFSGKRFELDA